MAAAHSAIGHLNPLAGGKVLGSARARKYVAERVTAALLAADFASVDDRFKDVPDAAMMADIIEVFHVALSLLQLSNLCRRHWTHDFLAVPTDPSRSYFYPNLHKSDLLLGLLVY